MFDQLPGIVMIEIFDRGPGIKKSLDILPVLGMGNIQDRYQVALTGFHSTDKTNVPFDTRDQCCLPGMGQT
jgi:hypothetical protein